MAKVFTDKKNISILQKINTILSDNCTNEELNQLILGEMEEIFNKVMSGEIKVVPPKPVIDNSGRIHVTNPHIAEQDKAMADRGVYVHSPQKSQQSDDRKGVGPA